MGWKGKRMVMMDGEGWVEGRRVKGGFVIVTSHEKKPKND